MKVEDLENQIDLLDLVKRDYPDYEVILLSKEENTYRVNPCPVCGHYDHFTIYKDTNSYFSFSGCCKGGSVYKYLQEVRHLSEEEAYEELKRLANIMPVTIARGKPKPADYLALSELARVSDSVNKPTSVDYTDEINNYYNNTTDFSYFKSRGLSQEIIDKYKLSIVGDYAVLPFWKEGKVVYYTQRAIKDNIQPRYKNLQGSLSMFNEHYLEELTGEPIIICEGIFDALSVEELGFKAVSINSVANINKLLEKVEKLMLANQNLLLLTAFDNDEAGRDATSKVLHRITNARQIPIPQGFKDINEWYIEDKEGISQVINKVIKHLTKPDVVSIYLEEFFKEDVLKQKSYLNKKTGFDTFDKSIQGLYAGLYVVGGITSVGKTTFMHQLADQLAEQEQDVIYFTLEQSKLELVSKSLSRFTAKKNINNATTSLQIRSGYQLDNEEQLTLLMNAVREYAKPSEHISIVEGNYKLTIENIRKYIDKYIKENEAKPIVFIDYLQVLQTDKPYLTTDKQRIDYIITELKRISRDFDITLFVVSSLNRNGYTKPIDLEAFKESGGIEYTADVVLGLQYKIDKSPITYDDIDKAKNKNPREIELICLKNRYGKDFEVSFKYYPEYDLFVEDNNKYGF